MSELEKILITLVKRLEKLERQQEVGLLMQHLLVLQLDGRLEISDETMRLYLDGLKGTMEKVDVFQKHVVEKYFS